MLKPNPVQLPGVWNLVYRLLIVMIIALAGSSAFAGVDTVRFVVTGDTRGLDNGVNTTVLGEIVQATITENADFILIAGDLVNGNVTLSVFESQLNTWIATMQPLYDTGIGVYPCRGNHDRYSKEVWDEVFSDTYALPSNGPVGEENLTFSFTYKNILILGLDQYVSQSRINQTWLDEQLASNKLSHIFSYAHEPAFKTFHLDCMDDYPTQRNDFWSSLTAAGSRIYFTGHDHFYDHSRIDDGDGDTSNDLHQIITATGGAPLFNGWEYDGENGPWMPIHVYHEEVFGYVLVEVIGLDVTTTWKHRVAPGIYEPGGDVFTYAIPLQAPVIVSDPVIEARVDQPYVYDVDATGVLAPIFDLTISPVWMTIDTITGRITGSPASGQEGIYTVEVVATNSEGTDIQSFSIDVNDAFQVGIVNINLASLPSNNLTENTLICSYDLTEDAITAATAWYRNGSPQMSLYFPVEGGTTNMATDYSGNGLVVDVTDTPTWEAIGSHDGFGAMSLDGNDHLIVSDAEALDVNFVTLSAWINVRRFRHDQRIISKEFGVVQPYSIYTMLLSGDDNDKLALRLGLEGQDRVEVAGVSSIPLDQWVHVAATFDGSQVVLYVNGLEDMSQSTTGILRHNDEPVFIGASQFSPDRNFDGLIDDVRIYGFALSLDQVWTLFNVGSETIVPQETVVGDVWKAWVTPFVSGLAGEAYPSNGLTIYDSPAAPVIVSTPVTLAPDGQLYTYDVNADGSPAPTYLLTTAPEGMTIDSITGWINWIAYAGPDVQVAVLAESPTGTDNQSFTIHVPEPPVITSTPVVTAIVGQQYSYDVDATSDLIPTYGLTTFPPGMTIDPVTGVIEWTPASFGEFGVTVVASNTTGEVSQSFTIDVDEIPQITSTAPAGGVVGYPYTYDVEATGDPTPIYALLTAPVGMSVDSTTGVIEWTPVSSGEFDVTVEAENTVGADSQSFIIDVDKAPTIVSTPPTVGAVGELYTYDVEAIGDPTPTYELSTAPLGMSVDSITGVIGWLPDSLGEFDVVVRAENPVGSDSQSFTIDVYESPIITSTPPVLGTVGGLYTYDVDATGNPTPTYALITAPPGMTIELNTGVVEWTPADTGSVEVTVEAINSEGSDTQDFTIESRSCPSILVLNAGWNHISVNIAPEPADMLAILSGIVDEVNIVKQCDGKFCIPGSSCEVDPWDALSAYDIHMKTAGSVPLCGVPVPCDSTINLVPGWNCVSYLPTTPQEANIALQSVMTCLNICKAPDGTFYIPDQPNFMGAMVAGNGYKMHLDCVASLTYPCDDGPLEAPSISIMRADPRHFILEHRTEDFQAIVVSIVGDFHNGDEIGLFTSSGLLAGSAVCTDAVVPIAAWADDPMTPEKDGFAPDETITWRLWRSTDSSETIVVPGLINGVAAFGESPYMTVEIDFNSSDVLPLTFDLQNNYPNPFNAGTVFRFSLPIESIARLTVYNIMGQRVRTLVDKELAAGEHEVEWDGSDNSGRPVATGVYLYRLTAGPYDQTRKMLLLK